METVLAAWLPVALTLLLVRWRGSGEWRAAALVFSLLTLVWTSPYWLTDRTPAALDYLAEDVVPWRVLEPPGFESANALLSDPPLQFLPWREVSRRVMLQGELPLLNRHAGSGSPLLENPQSAPFYPISLLGLPFSLFAWPLFSYVCKLLLSLHGMYLFLRAEAISHGASVIGSVAFGFCAYQIAFALFPHTNVTVLLPWFLLAIRTTVHGAGWSGAAGAAVVLALLFSGGHPESVLHVSFLAIPYALHLVAAVPRKGRALLRILVMGTLGLALTAPLIIPLHAYLPFMERSARLQRDTSLLAGPGTLAAAAVPFVVPDHFAHTKSDEWPAHNFSEIATQYAGLLTLVVAIVAVILRGRGLRFWIVSFLTLSVVAFELPGIRDLLSEIPILGVTIHGRIRFLLAFVLAVLGAHAVALLEDDDPKARRALLMTAAALGVVAALIVVVSLGQYERFGTASRVGAASVLQVTLTLAAVFALSRPFRFRIEMATLLLAADLFVVMGAYNPAVRDKFAYPVTPSVEALSGGEKPFRVLGLNGALIPNTAAILDLEQIGVHDPAAFEPYLRVLSLSGYDRRFYFNVFHRLPPHGFLSFLGVRNVIGPPATTPAPLPIVHAGADAVVYRNPDALPRYFIPRAVVESTDPAGAAVASEDPFTVFVARNESGWQFGGQPARLSLASYGPNGARIKTSAATPGFAASSEPALPGWRLEMDGEAWPVQIINGCFVGWRIPVGDHEFRLVYRPPHWEFSLAMSAFALCAVLGLVYLDRRINAREPGSQLRSSVRT